MSPSYFCSRCLPQPQSLPPGTAVERCCAPVTRLGLETSRWKTLPLRTDPPAAHASLLDIGTCNRKSGCGSQRCSCRKTWNGLLCCMWYSCTNSASPGPLRKHLKRRININTPPPPPPPPHTHTFSSEPALSIQFNLFNSIIM